MIRDDIKAAQIAAMKAGDKETRNAVSLIQAAVKNRDIEARTGKAPEDDDSLVIEVLQKMVKQRRESIDMYEKGNRPELAAAEAAEVTVIERFLPQMMDEAETRAAIESIKADLGAVGMKYDHSLVTKNDACWGWVTHSRIASCQSKAPVWPKIVLAPVSWRAAS